MKFDTYADYVNKATLHFSSKENLRVPVECMILSEEMFNLFNGSISFGVDSEKKSCCGSGECQCKNKEESTKTCNCSTDSTDCHCEGK